MTPQSGGRRIAELAGGAIDAEDARVLDRMAALYEALDPVPDGLVERIQFGITLDALHAEVAELQRSADLVGVRSGGATAAQTVTFTSSNLTTMVTITLLSTDRVRIDGWAAPGAGFQVELHGVSGVVEAVADEDGRFVFEDVPRGLVRFMLKPPAGTTQAPVITPSIEL